MQHADIKGYQFSREDVDARSLANLYARYMGNVFTHEMKPLEVEILVAEVGAQPGQDQIFHILYDGTVVDEDRFTALGGEAETITARLARAYNAEWSLGEALKASVHALTGGERELSSRELEVAVLDRGNGRRAFRRILEAEAVSYTHLDVYKRQVFDNVEDERKHRKQRLAAAFRLFGHFGFCLLYTSRCV